MGPVLAYANSVKYSTQQKTHQLVRFLLFLCLFVDRVLSNQGIELLIFEFSLHKFLVLETVVHMPLTFSGFGISLGNKLDQSVL